MIRNHFPSSIQTAGNSFQSHLQDCSVIFQMNFCKANYFPVRSLLLVSHHYQSLNFSSSGKAFGDLTQGTLLSSAVPPSSALCTRYLRSLPCPAFPLPSPTLKFYFPHLAERPVHLCTWDWDKYCHSQDSNSKSLEEICQPLNSSSGSLSQCPNRGTHYAFSCPNCIKNSL